MAEIRWREHATVDRDGFLAAGHRERDFFAHRSFFLPKAAPDGETIAAGAGLKPRPGQLWQVLVYALPEALDGVPRELFFDDDLMWHRQQYGLPGQIATAGVLVRGRVAYTSGHHSDLVQRISRRREHKTHVEKRFTGWDRMLLNAILTFAVERGLRTVMVPTAPLAMTQTDPARTVQPELFERVYDRHVRDRFDVRERDGWWEIDVDANRDRIVRGVTRSERLSGDKTICLCHDIEYGLGHFRNQPFIDESNEHGPARVREMLAVEASAGIRSTYNVVGSLLPELRGHFDSARHCLGFHSFDHRMAPDQARWRRAAHRANQELARCRKVDFRIKGYRPPRSKLGPDADDGRLADFNFEWLASSHQSFGFQEPRMERGIVKLPIAFDDFALVRGEAYESWEERVLARVAAANPAIFSLHDCYSPRWLHQYPKLLSKLQDLGEFKTLDELAAEVTLASAV